MLINMCSSSGVSYLLHPNSRSFWIEFRMGVNWARRCLSESIPRFNTMDEWLERKSTKIDTCAQMCLHVLSRDDAPKMIFKNGTVTFPPLPQQQPGE